MWKSIALCLSLFLSAAIAPVQDPELVPDKLRSGLRGLVVDLAKLALASEVEELRGLLLELGDVPADHERFERRWERELARGEDSVRGRTSAAKKLDRQVDALARLLDELEPQARARLATLILQLDADHAGAHAALGHAELDGSWLDEHQQRGRTGRARVAGLLRDAAKIPVEIDRSDELPAALAQVLGPQASSIRAHGVSLCGDLPVAKLERMLRQFLRAAALSQALLGGELELPRISQPYRMVLTSGDQVFERALQEAEASGGISPADAAFQREHKTNSIIDRRGWSTYRWGTEADLESNLLWDILHNWFSPAAQPCLFAGHLNWISLSFFGCTLPTQFWEQRSGGELRSSSVRPTREETLWRSAGTSLYGCRAWIVNRVRAGEEFPWARAMLDEVGKIRDEALLKTTLVCEYLQERGELSALEAATRRRTDRVAGFEEGLGLTLPEFEAQWRDWLLGRDSPPGLAQRLLPAAEPEAADPEGLRALEALQGMRAQALAHLNAYHEAVELDPQLSSQARAHAAYLELNEDQQSAWPDAHEQYPDRDGFSAAGAWAGLHGVIDFGGDPVRAVESWMGTFYHRLPLLEPGLFGVGYGRSGRVVVLDIGSLIAPCWETIWVAWPPPDAREVPRSFTPELPNPVPGEDQSAWGFPITIQAYWAGDQGEHDIELVLYEGSDTGGDPVPGHLLTPSRPAFDKLAPPDAFCFIPKQQLKANHTYTVQARCGSPERVEQWSFKTAR